MNQRGLALTYFVLIMAVLIGAGCANNKRKDERVTTAPAHGQYLDQCPGKPEGESCWTGLLDDKEVPSIKPDIPATEPNGCSMIYPSRSVPSEPVSDPCQ